MPPVATTPIRIGQSVSGTISSVGEWHDYPFTATAGQVVLLDATGDCVDGLGWKLLTPSGALEDLGGSCRDLGPETLEDAGTWTIEVYSDTTATGPYGFNLSKATPVP